MGCDYKESGGFEAILILWMAVLYAKNMMNMKKVAIESQLYETSLKSLVLVCYFWLAGGWVWRFFSL